MFVSSGAFAQLGYRTAEVLSVEAESADRTGYNNILYVKQSGTWITFSTGETLGGCSEYSYFNAQENPHLTSIVLAARVSKTPIKVIVDNESPKIGENCKLLNVAM